MTTDAPKPPLSNPMAEALAEDAAEARAVAAQTPPAAPEPDPAPEPIAAPTDEPAATEEPAAPEPTENTPKPKPRRSTEEVMASRIGAKTKEALEAKTRADKAESENATLRKLLEAQGKTVEDAPTPAPEGDRRYTQTEVQAEAKKVAAAQAFTDRANETYNAGKEKFGDWDAKMATLAQAGLYSDQLLEAAIESGAPVEVMRHLATELGEAERIAELSPLRMGAEITKLASKLTKPAGARVSGAPAPIDPVTGSVTPVVDLKKLADSDNMAAWVEQRKKSGDPWAQGRKRA